MNSDDIFFASRWEYTVYQELLRSFDRGFIRPQYRVEIKPRTYVYPAMYWVADFAIVSPKGEVLLLVEAKGFVTSEFKVRMKLLEYTHPNLWRLVVVVKNGETDQPIDCSRKRTCNLETLSSVVNRLVPI